MTEFLYNKKSERTLFRSDLENSCNIDKMHPGLEAIVFRMGNRFLFEAIVI